MSLLLLGAATLTIGTFETFLLLLQSSGQARRLEVNFPIGGKRSQRVVVVIGARKMRERYTIAQLPWREKRGKTSCKASHIAGRCHAREAR